MPIAELVDDLRNVVKQWRDSARVETRYEVVKDEHHVYFYMESTSSPSIYGEPNMVGLEYLVPGKSVSLVRADKLANIVTKAFDKYESDNPPLNVSDCGLRICGNCDEVFTKVPYDGVGEPSTIEMVEGMGSDYKLYHFCSKYCHTQWEEAHPIN